MWEQFMSFEKVPYFPVCEAGDGALTDSKLSGIPWLGNGESWPECQNCNRSMQLLVQINLDSLPKDVSNYGSGLLQLFYCTNGEPHCEVECGSWFWNDKAMLVRVVSPSGESSSPKQTMVANAFPPKLIRRWEAGEKELPRICEIVDLVELSIDETDALYEAEGDETFDGPAGGDKLGGWPDWIQGVEYPECRQCQKPMRLVYQIDSDVNTPYMWGDSGCGHITQCAEHRDVLAFGWACM